MKAILSIAFSVFLLFSATLVPATNVSVGIAAQEETRVLSLENAWNQAESQKDTRALSLLLADTLSYIDIDGSVMDKTQFLASTKDRWVQATQIVNESVAAHIYGQSAVVVGVYRESGTNKGKPYQHRGRFTDTWIKMGNSWQCVASQSTLITQ